jgi:hypothetical protein
MEGKCGLDASASRQESMVCSCEHGNELSVSPEDEEFLD